MRILIFIMYLGLLISCNQQDLVNRKVYRHHSRNNFSEWVYEYTDSSKQVNNISSLKEELILNLVDSFIYQDKKYYKHHFYKPFYSDIEGVFISNNQQEVLLSWTLTHTTINSNADSDFVKEIASDEQIFNFDFVPPPPNYLSK